MKGGRFGRLGFSLFAVGLLFAVVGPLWVAAAFMLSAFVLVYLTDK